MKIKIGTAEDGVMEVDGAPLTLVVPDPKHHDELSYPQCVTIDYDTSRYHGERVSQAGLHKETARLFMLVFEMQERVWLLDDGQLNVRLIQERGKDMHRHILGLMDMTLKLQDMGLSVAWKYPETGLHPAHQLGLGDVAIYFSQRSQEK